MEPYLFINRIAKRLKRSHEFLHIAQLLDRGKDATLFIFQSARPLMVSAFWARNPRPCLYVVSGEENAQRAAQAIAAWVGPEHVLRYPLRQDLPWKDGAIDGAVIGRRTQAVSALSEGRPCIVVTSMRALMRRVPPKGVDYFHGIHLQVGQEYSFQDLPGRLVAIGYSQQASGQAPGTFHVQGDSVQVFPAQLGNPVRLEFFGDEIDRIRQVVAATGQTISDLQEVVLEPAREISINDETISRATKALYNKAQNSHGIASDLELIQGGAADPSLEKYLTALYGSSASPIDHMAEDVLVVVSEPKALMDDALRAYEELDRQAEVAGEQLEGLYTLPKDMDLGCQQRLNLTSIMTSGALVDATIQVRQPNISGSDTKLLAATRQLLKDDMSVLFAIPDRSAREFMESSFADEKIAFIQSLSWDKENNKAVLSPEANEDVASIKDRSVIFCDLALPWGTIIPSAGLGIFSVADLSSRMNKKVKERHYDPTKVTFPFKPGDYVVHSVHGIALFAAIVRQEVAGKERDYFLLEYAGGDKLYVPLEQVDKITRFIGADSHSPRLTRLNTADWSRATSKARKSAKKIAFDLVDLYTRRSTARGFAFSGDTQEQVEMEDSFGYPLTRDQESALTDIKMDMESGKPMDRLLCGDVGFGKTEVALRAAFKALEDNKQVMVLCPTTILAEQHFETFFQRFTPFGKTVRSLSRFVTPAQQKKTLQGFEEGMVDVLIGTHRLLSNDVNPHDLGLVIVDEEQRFGVQHKEQLKNIREQVDVLTLSATPIPRTMQSAISGVRDMSLITTPPPGRQPVQVHVGEYDEDVVGAAIRQEMARSGQVYYVSNRVNTIEDAVQRVHKVAPEARVGVAHGQMSAKEVENVMMEFQEHEIDVLVATTIVESGIDNSRSNTLIIEDSQRLGLAQLYQLKGRVGRGHKQAYAYFMFPPDQPLTPEATERLMAINEFQELGSGMRIAMRDLEIRGAGSLMGAEQHGNLTNVGFDLFTQMLAEAVAEARGEVQDGAAADVTINLGCDFYLGEDYIPEVDKRVLIYRKLAVAQDLGFVHEVQAETEKAYGPLPAPARNLFDRTRLRIRAQRLGVTVISLVSGRIMYQGLDLDGAARKKFKARRAIIYPKSHKMAYPYAPQGNDLMSCALSVLEEIGGDDQS